MARHRRFLRTLAENIKDLRRKAQWSQEDAAHHTDLSIATYQRVENGRIDPTGFTLTRLALGFGVDEHDLLRPLPEKDE